jgi:hypothetical protein
MLVYMPFDKIMNKLQGEKWVLKKEWMAQQRANRALARMKPEAPGIELPISPEEKTTLAA